MRLITINLPESYLRALEEICNFTGTSRSELLRQAIRSRIITDLGLVNKLKKVSERKKVTEFFDYCINCEKKLHTTEKQNHFCHKKIEIFELKFCCSCYEQFKDTTFNEFPAHLIENINKKINAYKKHSSKVSIDGK